MILYLDTSALIKLYVEERHSAEVAQAVRDADAIATSLLAYPEARATLARAHREHRLSSADLRSALTQFLEDWERIAVIETRDDVLKHAGSLAERHALRGADAVHLASALQLFHGLDPDDAPMQFLAFDVPLSKGAHREHLVLHSLSPSLR
jgi:uncharacterized protein